MISLNRGEAMGTNTRLERLETTLDSFGVIEGDQGAAAP